VKRRNPLRRLLIRAPRRHLAQKLGARRLTEACWDRGGILQTPDLHRDKLRLEVGSGIGSSDGSCNPFRLILRRLDNAE
jgi:hypothetical protein